jgi:hypothetical protein
MIRRLFWINLALVIGLLFVLVAPSCAAEPKSPPPPLLGGLAPLGSQECVGGVCYPASSPWRPVQNARAWRQSGGLPALGPVVTSAPLVIESEPIIVSGPIPQPAPVVNSCTCNCQTFASVNACSPGYTAVFFEPVTVGTWTYKPAPAKQAVKPTGPRPPIWRPFKRMQWRASVRGGLSSTSSNSTYQHLLGPPHNFEPWQLAGLSPRQLEGLHNSDHLNRISWN